MLKRINRWEKAYSTWYLAAVAVLGVIEQAVGALAPLLGEYGGAAITVIALIGVFLRSINQGLSAAVEVVNRD